MPIGCTIANPPRLSQKVIRAFSILGVLKAILGVFSLNLCYPTTLPPNRANTGIKTAKIGILLIKTRYVFTLSVPSLLFFELM